MCRHAIDEVGSFPFIIAHMGGWHDWQEVPEKLAGTGCYLDTSFSTGTFTPLPDGYWQPGDEKMLTPKDFTNMVRAFGADHIIFGSDSPWSDQKTAIDWIRDCQPGGRHGLSADQSLSPDDIWLILGENARQLLRL